jgi:excisionase family DNA binding protein
MVDDVWYTPREIANILKVSKMYVLNLIKEEKIGYVKLSSRTYRISDRDLKIYLNNTTIGE